MHDGELADLNQYSINVTNPLGQCSGSARILVEGTTRPWGQCHRAEYQLAGAHSLVLLRLPLGLPESAWGCGPACEAKGWAPPQCQHPARYLLKGPRQHLKASL